MEMIQLFGMPGIYGPGLATIHESSDDHCLIYLEFGLEAYTSPLPHVGTEFAEGSTCFCYSAVDLIIKCY